MKISRRPLTIIIAVVATAGVFLIANATGAELKIPVSFGNMDETRAMPLGAVIFITAILGLLAWALATVLERATKNARGVWTVVAAFLMFGTLPAVFQLDLDGSAIVWQSLLHLVFGGVLIAGFWPTFTVPADSQSQTAM